MSNKPGSDDLGKVSRDADELLGKLDAIGGESKGDLQPRNSKPNGQTVGATEFSKSITKKRDSGSHNRVGDLTSAAALAAVAIVAAGAILSAQRRDVASPRDANSGVGLNKSGIAPQQPEQKPQSQDSTNSIPTNEVYFEGIKLPITNNLCNKKNTFCIYGLASLVEDEKGSASYSFEDSNNGQRVSIQGEIRIASVERDEAGARTFSFSFRDNQLATTAGWAAAGTFYLDQDVKQPGILTRFKTTESFGPKTPVGLENTSYLFPR